MVGSSKGALGSLVLHCCPDLSVKGEVRASSYMAGNDNTPFSQGLWFGAHHHHLLLTR